MTSSALTLVLLSAALHAYWNSLLKRASDKTAFTWLYLSWSVLLGLPVALWRWQPVSTTAFGWALVSGLLYAAYYVTNARMYEHGELSVGYPIARGLAPALTLIWAALFLGERPSPYGLCGIALIVIAIGVLVIGTLRRVPLAPTALGAALLTGTMTSGYAITDKVGALSIHQEVPTTFVWLAYTLSHVGFSLAAGRGLTHARLSEQWRRAARDTVLVGLLSIGSYLLVVFAVQTSNVSYVLPLRSTAILFGVVLGTERLGESRAPAKWVGAGLMCVGAVLIATRG